MSDTAVTKKPDDTYGILTDAGIERLKQRIGVQYKKPEPPHNYEVTWDGSRHFAFGYGDDNPLWCDPEYAKKTRWGGLIAPPNFLYTMGDPVIPNHTPEEKALLKGDPLIGLGSYQSQMEFEWWRPLKQGDRLKKHAALVGVRVNENSKFSGRSVAEIHGYIYRTQNNELHAIRRGTWVRAERHATAARKKEVQLPEPYTAAQLAEIDACYEAETIRGAQPRYFEDVQIGDPLQTIVRGPMRTSDLIIWHMGWGMQLTPPGAFRLSYKLRKKIPGMFTPNAMNVPDTVQRLHWEKEWANQLGIPVSYDYGGLRETFMTNILTNWMGDDAWLWKLTCQHRKFVYTNDTYWIKGKVTNKVQVDGRNEVHVDVWVENQWGVNVSPGNAVVLLPTRSAPVTLPSPANEDIDAMFRHEVAVHAR
ncbi:MAG: MaoC family dehydratase N-terminal domain-containing protein [Burkholderiaceae bacterium]|nr:MaoC family dehydratase N-terminal domain-containing protein [Burkholderiaceae bacterium]